MFSRFGGYNFRILSGSTLIIKRICSKSIAPDTTSVAKESQNNYNSQLQIIKMKGSNAKKGIFIEIGKKLNTSKPYTKRPSLSFTSTNQTAPTTMPQVNQTQPVLPCRRKISQPCSSMNGTYAMISNINDDFLFMRKENYLNTKFNIRKRKLKEITKQNKQLYERINSQKSMYSSSELSKSFQSNCDIKKRLSQSKLSQRLNNSRTSSRSRNDSSKANRLEKKKQVKISIKTANIKNTELGDLQGFKALFKNQIFSTKNQPRRDQQQFTFNSYRHNHAYTTNLRPPTRKSIEASKTRVSSGAINEGGLLHRIAEEMIGNGGKFQDKKKSAYFKNKKMFNF